MGVVTDLTINLESTGSPSGRSLHTRITFIAEGVTSIELIARTQSWLAMAQSEQHARPLKGTTKTNMVCRTYSTLLEKKHHYSDNVAAGLEVVRSLAFNQPDIRDLWIFIRV
jgi:hypothetical protein